MLAIVSRNPSDVCRVSAVPTACDGTDLVTIVLNCAESAMTKNPHSHATATMTQTLDANKPPMTTAQLPLTAMARITSRSCPIRSATQPPHTHPNPPTAMAPNANRPSTTSEGTTPPARARAAALATTNAVIHVQKLYSSHMCPRYPPVARRHCRSRSTVPARRHENGGLANANGPSRHPAATSTAPTSAPADTTVTIARPRPEENHVAIIFMAGGYTPARQNPVKKRETRASG